MYSGKTTSSHKNLMVTNLNAYSSSSHSPFLQNSEFLPSAKNKIVHTKNLVLYRGIYEGGFYIVDLKVHYMTFLFMVKRLLLNVYHVMFVDYFLTLFLIKI